MERIKAEHTSQLRQLRHHLATTAIDKQHQSSSQQQIEQLLSDCRRENQLLRDEVYTLRDRTEKLQEERVGNLLNIATIIRIISSAIAPKNGINLLLLLNCSLIYFK